MGLALALDEPRYISGLDSVAMDSKPTLGQRLVEVLIPSRFKDLNALHLATGFAYSTVHKWKTGESSPHWKQVCQVAELIGADPFLMISGQALRPRGEQRVADHPEWAAAMLRAQTRFPGRVPDRFYELAGETRGATIPEHLDEHFALGLARFWFDHASNADLSRADTAAALRELDDLRASRKRPTE